MISIIVLLTCVVVLGIGGLCLLYGLMRYGDRDEELAFFLGIVVVCFFLAGLCVKMVIERADKMENVGGP